MQEDLPHFIGHNYDLIILMWLGASAKAGSNYLSAKKRRVSYRIADYIVTLVIGAFTAALFGMISYGAGQSEIAVGISVGLGSWLGVEGLNTIASKVINRNDSG